METCPAEGVVKEKFPNTRKPSQWWVCGGFWNLRGQHNQGKTKTLIRRLTATPSGKVAQMLMSATSNWGAEQGGAGCIA